MNISIDNYGDKLSCCAYDGTITLGYEFMIAKKELSNKDFDTFICDVITHELIHDVLMKHFDNVTSKLFDTVEHLFCNYKVKQHMFKLLRNADIYNSGYPKTWNESIIDSGINSFYSTYHIDMNALVQSYIITGRK